MTEKRLRQQAGELLGVDLSERRQHIRTLVRCVPAARARSTVLPPPADDAAAAARCRRSHGAGADLSTHCTPAMLPLLPAQPLPNTKLHLFSSLQQVVDYLSSGGPPMWYKAKRQEQAQRARQEARRRRRRVVVVGAGPAGLTAALHLKVGSWGAWFGCSKSLLAWPTWAGPLGRV